MRFETNRARDYYREAVRMLPEVDMRAQRPGLMMASISYTLLDELERDQWHVLDQRVALTPILNICLARQAWGGGGRGVIRQLGQTQRQPSGAPGQAPAPPCRGSGRGNNRRARGCP